MYFCYNERLWMVIDRKQNKYIHAPSQKYVYRNLLYTVQRQVVEVTKKADYDVTKL